MTRGAVGENRGEIHTRLAVSAGHSHQKTSTTPTHPDFFPQNRRCDRQCSSRGAYEVWDF